jgi:chemotaxis protein MotB
MAKKKGGAHHGGAWKVAYADFVTAMMALFMVLWISAQDETILLSTSNYFQNPFKSPLQARSGLLDYESQKPSNSSDGNPSNEFSRPSNDARPIDLQFLNSIAKDLYRLLSVDENLAERPVEIHVTADGLRITLFDRAKKPLFIDNTPEFTEWGEFVVQSLAWMIDRHNFNVVIEGHTRAGLDLPAANYSEWELSADRANAARRALTFFAVEPARIERVSGFGSTRPVPAEAHDSESNQRVSISLSPSLRARSFESSARTPFGHPIESPALAPLR